MENSQLKCVVGKMMVVFYVLSFTEEYIVHSHRV